MPAGAARPDLRARAVGAAQPGNIGMLALGPPTRTGFSTVPSGWAAAAAAICSASAMGSAGPTCSSIWSGLAVRAPSFWAAAGAASEGGGGEGREIASGAAKDLIRKKEVADLART